MKRLIPTLLLSLFAAAAFAQTNGQPPEQAPAGNPGKISKQPATSNPITPGLSSTSASDAPKTRADRRAARKAKRAAKVGDKPLN